MKERVDEETTALKKQSPGATVLCISLMFWIQVSQLMATSVRQILPRPAQ